MCCLYSLFILFCRWLHGVFKSTEKEIENPGFVTKNGRLTFIARALRNTNLEINPIAR